MARRDALFLSLRIRAAGCGGWRAGLVALGLMALAATGAYAAGGGGAKPKAARGQQPAIPASPAKPLFRVPTAPPNEPVRMVSRPGQFDIVASDVVRASALAQAGSEVWDVGAQWRLLPERLPTPIFVRAQRPPDGRQVGTGLPFQVVAEPGGVVSVTIDAADDLSVPDLYRALVRALLVRLQVLHHGTADEAHLADCVELAWVERAALLRQPAWAQQQRSDVTGLRPPRLPELLSRAVDDHPAERARSVAACWLANWLEAEAGAGSEWRDWVWATIDGRDPWLALGEYYRNRWQDATDCELAWRVEYYYDAGLGVAQLTPAESRAWLADIGQWVLARDGQDAGYTLEGLWALRDKKRVIAAVQARRFALLRQISRIHPWYFNAARSLGVAYDAIIDDNEKEWRKAVQMLRSDFSEADAKLREAQPHVSS